MLKFYKIMIMMFLLVSIVTTSAHAGREEENLAIGILGVLIQKAVENKEQKAQLEEDKKNRCLGPLKPKEGHYALGSCGNANDRKSTQRYLKMLNYYHGEIDGDFGWSSKNALVAWENNHIDAVKDGFLSQKEQKIMQQEYSVVAEKKKDQDRKEREIKEKQANEERIRIAKEEQQKKEEDFQNKRDVRFNDLVHKFKTDPEFANEQLMMRYFIYHQAKILHDKTVRYVSDSDIERAKFEIKTIEKEFEKYHPKQDTDKIWDDMIVEFYQTIERIKTAPIFTINEDLRLVSITQLTDNLVFYEYLTGKKSRPPKVRKSF